MATHNPTSVTYNPETVIVESQDSTPYQDILESMKGNIYAIRSIYIKANTNDQILNNLGLSKFDSNGNIQAKTVVPAIDPNQYQSAIRLEFENNNYVLNGRTTIDYLINPNESISFYIETLVLDNADFLDFEMSENMKDFLKRYGFFSDMTEKINLEDYNGE